MADVLLAVAVVGVVIGAFMVLWFLNADERDQVRLQKMRAAQDLKVTDNHRDLALIVNDLMLVHDLGYITPFPDEAFLERSRQALRVYKEEIHP